MQRSDFELMAPAGSREALAAAVQAGADSVYFGVGELNMRALASSAFTVENLPEIVGFVHEHGVKAYLTVNTVVFDEDMPEVERVLDAARAAQIDAVIASDVAVIAACRSRGIEVHLSTQLNIANTAALRFYARDADVAVLARELTLEQIACIARAIDEEDIRGPSGRPVRLELFCHGALCMAASGRCYMSLHTRGKSANRGACLQTCRRSYVLKDAERDIELELANGYLLSPKDLKTIDFLDRIVAAGVRVFKIEGRARGPEYVHAAVACYDEALSAVADGTFSPQKVEGWNARLSEVFNRGFWDGYYLGERVVALAGGYGSQAIRRKRFAGKCVNYFARAGVAQFLIQAEGFEKGARLLVTGPTTGAVEFDAAQIVCDEAELDHCRQGQSITVKVPSRVRENDKLYVMELRTGNDAGKDEGQDAGKDEAGKSS